MDAGGADWRFVAVGACRLVGLPADEHGAEGIDGIALEAEPDVGVDGGGGADVGVAEELLDRERSMPCSRRRAAAECRRSRKRMRRIPARSRKRRKAGEVGWGERSSGRHRLGRTPNAGRAGPWWSARPAFVRRGPSGRVRRGRGCCPRRAQQPIRRVAR